MMLVAGAAIAVGLVIVKYGGIKGDDKRNPKDVEPTKGMQDLSKAGHEGDYHTNRQVAGTDWHTAENAAQKFLASYNN